MIPFLDTDDPFPPPELALQQPNGLLAAGGDLSPSRLLDAYALTQGLVTKIAPAPLTTSADTVLVPALGHVDVGRSLALWKSYGAPAAIIRRGDWVDRPSAGIPALYTMTALTLGQALEQQGRASEAQKLRERGIDVAEGAHIVEWFVGARSLRCAWRTSPSSSSTSSVR